MADQPDNPVPLDPPATTPSEDSPSSDAPQESLPEMIARATALYAVKDYSAAADIYSEATALQAEINGEMAPENAELLYSYGKCLYFVAVKNSDVLGVNSAGAKLSSAKPESKPSKKRKTNGETSATAASSASATNGTSNESAGKSTSADALPGLDLLSKTKEATPPANTSLFQITGDENWNSDDEDEEEDGADEGGDEEEEDDLTVAFEVLDLARVLFLRQLETLPQVAPDPTDKGKSTAPSLLDLPPTVRKVKERIADIHDFQAEISLEGEKYANAIVDLRAALALQEELYPFESNFIAECHYKLSLALEFGSRTQQRDDQGNPVGEPVVDEPMRQESISEMEKAIDSCQQRIEKEQAAADNLEAGEKKEAALKDIKNVREIVTEMETRLVDLNADPVNAVEEVNKDSGLAPAEGLSKEMMEATKENAARMLEQISGTANDLSGLVKRKKSKVQSANASASATPEPSAAANGAASALGKRKVGFADEVDVRAETKKAKVEDTEDSGL